MCCRYIYFITNIVLLIIFYTQDKNFETVPSDDSGSNGGSGSDTNSGGGSNGGSGSDTNSGGGSSDNEMIVDVYTNKVIKTVGNFKLQVDKWKGM